MKNNVIKKIADKLLNTFFIKIPLSQISPREASDKEIRTLIDAVPKLTAEEVAFIKKIRNHPERIEALNHETERRNKSGITFSFYTKMPGEKRLY